MTEQSTLQGEKTMSCECMCVSSRPLVLRFSDVHPCMKIPFHLCKEKDQFPEDDNFRR